MNNPGEKLKCCENCTSINHKGNMRRTLSCLDSVCPCHFPSSNKGECQHEWSNQYVCKKCFRHKDLEYFHPSPSKEPDWEKEFDKKFFLKEFGIKCKIHSPCKGFDCIKDFIRQTISSILKEKVEEIKGVKKIEYGEASRWQLEEVGRMEYAYKNEGYNQAIDAIISLMEK